MAEIVEYRVERTLDELNLLVEFGLFTEAQAKKVASDRQNYEYRLRRRARSKLDFLEYIKYEINLLESIDNYRKTVIKDYYKHNRKKDEDLDRRILLLQAKKLNDIVRSRSAHVSSLFRKLTTTFQFDKMLWIAYIDFAISRKWNTRVTALYWRLLRVAGNDPNIWIAAARHEVEVNKAYDSARGLYLRALRHHPRSSIVWAEYFKMELRFMHIIVQRALVIFKSSKSEEEKSAEDIWVGDDEDEQITLEQDGEADVDEAIPTEECSKPEDDIVPLVNPIDQDDLITSGHLPKLVYDNAVKSLLEPKEYHKFAIDILYYMFISSTRLSKGLQSVKDHVITSVRSLYKEADDRVTEDLSRCCDTVNFLKDQYEHIALFRTNSISQRSSPAKRKKLPKSKLETLYECYESDGLQKTRHKFEDMEKSITNRTLSLYVGMIQIELWQLEKDKSRDQVGRIRSIYDRAIAKFGKLKPKLWYEYLKFELDLAKDLEDLDRINRLYERAQKTLDSSKVNQLIEKYTLLRDKDSKKQLEHSDYSDLED